MLTGNTSVLLHLGDPTHSFKAPMIYNPWFDHAGLDAMVVPLGVRAQEFTAELPLLMRATNVIGALVTMPHKVTALALAEVVGPAAAIAGAANAIKMDAEGRLVADMFDGAGFVSGMARHGRTPTGARALVVGCGGVGSAIAASLAGAGAAALRLSDLRPGAADALAERLLQHHPRLQVEVGDNDPTGCQIAVNATPMGMAPGDPMPLPVGRLAPDTFVGEVVMTQRITPFLAAASARGCPVQVGTDMLFEQIPAYLDFFGLPPLPSADQLRELAQLPS